MLRDAQAHVCVVRAVPMWVWFVDDSCEVVWVMEGYSFICFEVVIGLDKNRDFFNQNLMTGIYFDQILLISS